MIKTHDIDDIKTSLRQLRGTARHVVPTLKLDDPPEEWMSQLYIGYSLCHTIKEKMRFRKHVNGDYEVQRS